MMNNMMMDNMMPGSTMIMMCIVMVIGLIIFVMIIGATVYVVTRLLMKKSRTEDHPLMILKELYANNEISDEEYIRKRKIIKELK